MKKRAWGIAGAIVAVALGGFGLRMVSAQGVPTVTPLFYAGLMTEDGAPVQGVRRVTINLWASGDPQAGGAPLCVTDVPAARVENGRFRIALDGSCQAKIAATSDTWAEVVVNGETSLGRTKIGAVPYAIEAQHAVTASEAMVAQAAAGPLGQQVVPSGAVMAFDLDACPPGWSPFGAAAGRAVIGAGAGGGGISPRRRGDVVGEESHTMSVAEMPAHSHAGTTGTGNPLTYRVVHQVGTSRASNHATAWAGGPYGQYTDAEYPMAAHTHDFSTNAVGGGQAFTNMQPSIALLYCKKD